MSKGELFKKLMGEAMSLTAYIQQDTEAYLKLQDDEHLLELKKDVVLLQTFVAKLEKIVDEDKQAYSELSKLIGE